MMHLPQASTPFIGRHVELSQLEALIADAANRIITIVGPGGAGKTRLALEAARRQKEALASGSSTRFPDGVFFIPLAALESADEIWPALNQAVGFQPSSQDEANRSARQQLIAFLSGKTLLLVMDNFEQLLSGAEDLSDLTKAVPGIQVLATSRERLSLQGERLFSLDGMRYPEHPGRQVPVGQAEGYSAVRLFVQSAQRVDHSFRLQSDNMPDVSRICRLVDGLPLGIELAATWVDSISSAEIASEIESNLAFLQTEAHDVDARHHSMEAVFDASWRRLSADSQNLLARLTVFRGGFTRAAAEAVAQASLLQLNALIKKSLLQFDQEKRRYQMHRLLRQYGASKLASDPAAEVLTRDRHCEYFCQLLEAWAEGLKGERQLETITTFDLEVTNARAAWEWSVKRGLVEQIDQAIDALGLYADWHWLADDLADMCRLAAEKLVTINAANAKRVLSRVLAWQGLFLPEEQAVELLNQGQVLIDELESTGVDVRAERAWILRRLGTEIIWQDHEEAAHLLKQSVALYESLNDTWGAADVLGYLGANAVFWGKYEDSRRYYQEKVTRCRTIGDRRGLAESQRVLALNAAYRGDFEEGELLTRQSIALSEELSDLNGQQNALSTLGFTLWQLGRFSDAQAAYEESITLCDTLGRPSGEASGMVAFLLAQQGQAETAYTITQSALQDPVNDAFPFHRAFVQWGMGTLYLALGNHKEALYWLSQANSTFKRISHVTVQSGAQSCFTLANPTRENVRESIRSALAAGSVLAHILCLPAVALHFAKQKDGALAIELYTLVSRYDMVSRSLWYEELVGQPVRAVSEGMTAADVTAAQVQGQTRELAPTLMELAIHFGVLEEGDVAPDSEAHLAQDLPDLGQDVRYVRESLLGVGGQADVYLGRDQQTGERVAIKQLFKESWNRDPAAFERFLREAEVLAQLEHPNIVKMLAYLEDGGRPTIVMEYVPGGSLRDLLNESTTLPLERALPIALEVADALARAHHLHIAHRDLKPENVLLAADGTPRLSDFGLARLMDHETRLTEVGSLIGTFAYLSPEVVQGLEPDTRTDIWSFGIILYEMLAGRPPFLGSQVAATLTAIISDPAPDLAAERPDTPAELVGLINQMLVKDRERRIRHMRRIAADLELIASRLSNLNP